MNVHVVERARQAVSAAVFWVKKGDRVSVPFNIACGVCENCEAGWTSFCLQTNPTEGVDGAAYGYANMGPYDGGQAEYLRVPFADFNLLELPQGDEHKLDFTMLTDIFRSPREIRSSRSRRKTAPTASCRRRGASRGSTASSSPRGSGWARASAPSRATTASGAT